MRNEPLSLNPSACFIIESKKTTSPWPIPRELITHQILEAIA